MDIDSDEDMPLAKVMKQKSVGVTQYEENAAKLESCEKNNDCKYDCDIVNEKIPRKVAAEKKCLFEYEWPRNRSGDYFILEEQLIQFLDVALADERLEKLLKRPVSSLEENFLCAQGVWTKSSIRESNNVIKTEDACEFMAEYFPKNFQTYIELVHRTEMKRLVLRQEAQRIDVISGNIPNFMKRALKETVRYNSQLNRERKEERCAYFDLQTQIIHLPQKKRKYNPSNKSKRSEYPVALLPGQYQDYFKRYTSEELKMLPLNTVTQQSLIQRKGKSTTENEREETPTDEVVDENENGSTADSAKNSSEKKEDKDPFCGICMKGPEMNKRGLPEKLIHCSQCENSGHPSCLDMNKHIVQVIQTYPWQCMECKICTECLAPHDEDEMMFCDNCDRGYHSYCVGLQEIPKGRWVCSRCGKCSSCLSVNAVPEGVTGRWKNEYTKPLDGSEAEFLQIHCHSCSKLFRKGSFCPVCLKVYRTDDDHINPMVCCDVCDRWIHTDCDGIDEHRYMELSKDRQTSYTCILCRGEKEERMDSFHRKNR